MEETSEMAAFDEALLNALMSTPDYDSGCGACCYQDPMEQVEAILAMPEMQAIKRALCSKYAACDGGTTLIDDMTAELPESVIAWVMSEPS